jgi:flagellar motor protein MotB
MFRFHKIGKSGDFSPCEELGGLLLSAPISRTIPRSHFSADTTMNSPAHSRVRSLLAGSCALAAMLVTGCQNNPFQRPAGTAGALSPGQSLAMQSEQQKLTAQMTDLNRRLGQLDGNNADLHRQIADRDRQLQASQEQVAILQKQIGEAGTKWKEALAGRQDAEQKIKALQASTQFKGGAAISANNSVRQSLSMISLPGLEVRQDGEVVRIEIPSDRLFVPDTDQPTGNSTPILDEIANAIARTYPRQRIVVEAHGDGAGGANAIKSHTLTAAQAQAVFQQLVTRGRVPARQLSMLALGDNHPLAAVSSPQGKAKNRRVEIVIYPDTFDG